MAARIGDYILAGELRNVRRNGVFGWIEFAPDYGIRLELTGNMSGSLAGKHVQFTMPGRQIPEWAETEDAPEVIEELVDRQIGVVILMEMRRLLVPDVSTDEFIALPREEQKKHLIEKDCLHLEWASQNGTVVAQLVSPQIEFVDVTEDDEDDANEEPDDLDGDFGLGITEIHIDENGVPHVENGLTEDDEEEDDDPFGLCDTTLEQSVAEALGHPLAEDEESKSRKWEDIIPGLDPETKAMYEQWDEIFEGKKDQPVSYLFPKLLKLPKPENVSSDEEAEPFVQAILAQLALLSVALDVCEHFTPMETYRLLITEILPTAKVHPELAASEMVQHYSTSDFCKKCEEEFDAEFDAERRSNGEDESDEDSADGPSDSEDE